MTQSQQIMFHLNTGRTITSIEAVGLYGITRLAAVVHTLNKAGANIKAEYKKGVKAPYASYSI